jgi:hypothetical protein
MWRLLPNAGGPAGKCGMNAVRMSPFNVLKHRGYNLKHNGELSSLCELGSLCELRSHGHGDNHANAIFCMPSLPGFLFHGIQDLVDEDYKGSGASLRARASFGRRDAFFWALRYEVSRYLYQDWRELFRTVAGDDPDG